jgi:hypothetical protein
MGILPYASDAPDSMYANVKLPNSFSPFFGTLGTLHVVSIHPAQLHDKTDLVKCRHRLISTADLQLVPIRLIVPALFVWTLHYAIVSPRLQTRNLVS